MTKFLAISISAIILLTHFLIIVSAVKINEVELNPAGEDNKNEWLELYSASNIDLNGWHIENVKGKNLSLNDSFSGYKIITTPYNFLTNDKQKLILYDNTGNNMQETGIISDSANDGRSWQLCDDWVFIDSSKGEENNCENSDEEVIVEENETNEDAAEETDNDDKEIEEINSNTMSTPVKEQEITEILEVIKLEPKDIKSSKIWKSQTGKIKEYSLVGFALFCAVILIYLLKNGKNKGDNDF